MLMRKKIKFKKKEYRIFFFYKRKATDEKRCGQGQKEKTTKNK
jgi:hypothetical protein